MAAHAFLRTAATRVDWGISDVSAALGDPKYMAPFFRIPVWRDPMSSKADGVG
jgi:hypothetical protein